MSASNKDTRSTRDRQVITANRLQAEMDREQAEELLATLLNFGLNSPGPDETNLVLVQAASTVFMAQCHGLIIDTDPKIVATIDAFRAASINAGQMVTRLFNRWQDRQTGPHRLGQPAPGQVPTRTAKPGPVRRSRSRKGGTR